MATDKIIPQYLNKDEDERLVKSFEMTDALNVRVSHGDDGNQGVVKNVEGNLILAARNAADAIPSSGTNRVIGSVSSEAGRCIYFFLYNSAGDHGIYQYSSVSDSYRQVYEDSVLNFSERGFVKADVVINQFQEHLLYFTDNRNEPRKINATKALLGEYNSTFTGGTDSEKNKFLTVCKAPPQVPITFVFQSNEDLPANNLKEACFQFSYQYVYDDGEVSALSAYSRLSVSRTHTAFNAAAVQYLSSFNNQLTLTVENAAGPVEKIRVYARHNNSGGWFMIEELDNVQPPTNTTLTQDIVFRNDGAYVYASNEETNKPFDAVPHRAAAQCLAEGRLIYGNYTEGFDNLTTDVYQYPVYSPESVLGGEYDFLIQGEDALMQHPANSYGYYNGLYMGYGNDFAEAFYAPFNGVPQGIAAALNFAGNGIEGFFAAFPQNYATPDYTDLHFDVDLSEFPVGGFPSSMNPVVDFNAYLDADVCGIVARGTDDNAIPVTATTYAGNGTAVHTQTLYALHPENGNGAISNLNMNSPIHFQRQFAIGEAVTLDAFRDAVISGVMGDNGTGLNAVVSVSPGTTSAANSGNSHSSLDSNYDEGNYELFGGMTTVLGPLNGGDGDTWPIGTNNRNQLIVSLSGELKFRIHSSANITPTKIRFFVKLTGVDLDADRVLMPRVSTGNGNDFVSESAHSEIGQNYNGFSSIYETQEHSVSINSNNVNALGYTVEGYNTTANGMSALLFDYKASGLLDVFAERENVQSFKAGATHDLGVVYYDDRNRACGVQKTGSVGVEQFGAWRRGARNGPTEIDMRLLHTPPPWAERWAPVYTKNTSYDSILQVSIAEACLGKQTTHSDILSPQTQEADRERPVLSALSGGINGQIFLSLRTLEGKANSYKEFKGGQIDYKFLEGDRLRILEYVNSNGSTVRPGHDFAVTSYQYYSDDEENPIKLSVDSTNSSGVTQKDENSFRRTGWFLTVRDSSISNFGRSEVSLGTDFFSQKCIVEIYRPKKKEETQVYYEMGRSFPIVTTGGLRTHGGERSNSASPTAFSITINDAESFTSTQRLYLGDRVMTTASASGYVFIAGIAPLSQGLYRYDIDSSNPFAQNTIGTGVGSNTVATTAGNTNSVFPGVVTLTEADMYMRIREQLINRQDTFTPPGSGTSLLYDPTKVDTAVYEKVIVEDSSVSDFFNSKALSLGRPHIETPDQKEISRTSAVTYSEKFVSDSSRMNLSSFNPSLFPFKDYNSKNGGITFLIDGGESFFTLQENKVSSTPIGRTLIESAGKGQLVTSTNILGPETYFAGDFGPGTNPESVVGRFGRFYFCDISSGKVVQVSNKGIELISDKKMEAFFETLFASATVQGAMQKLPCGIDPENNEFIVTLEDTQSRTIIFGGDVVGSASAPPANPMVAGAEVRGHITPSTNLLTWENMDYPWDSGGINGDAYEPLWSSVGGAVIYADMLLDMGSVLVDPVHIGTGETVIADVLTTDGGFYGTALLSTTDGSINFSTHVIDIGANVGADASDAVTFGALTDNSKDTIAYSTSKEFWMSRYSFNPEMYANLHNRFFSYENGQIWRHNVNPLRGTFYGTAYDATLDVVSKKNPSMVKAYNALSLESNDTWAATVSNSSQNAAITEAMYDEREGMRYAKIPRDSTTPPLNSSTSKNQSNRIVLGEVESITGTTDGTIKFTSRISDLPFNVLDILYKLAATEVNTTRTISNIIDRKTLQVSSTTGIAVGDVLMAVSANSINGDKIRDYYLGIELASNSRAHAELYAVNVDYAPSPLHNEQVN